ncbi:MAG: saccharopine dehydrogenase C-terminal domain-containing protein [Thermovirgaceae bacterium]|nr:saccharopine dehydrogenase C-terminal domain-containing protein [Thermovirgaceae bacterium]
MKRVLVLGAGRVARPCVQYLLNLNRFHVTVVDISEENIKRVTGEHPCSEACVITPETDPCSIIDSLKPDLVICLLPPSFMTPVALACIRNGIHMIHPAYLDDEQRAMSGEVKASGAIFLAELGLDPGIDHMSAARTINLIHSEGGQVESFRSICGAIPSAEANTNPWSYKLSWAPASLVGASKRDARVMIDGIVHDWPKGKTYEHVYLEDIRGIGCFEVYANADSLPYLEIYGIPEARSIYRGTIRYPGWCETICKMNEIGLFEETQLDLRGHTFRSFMALASGSPGTLDVSSLLCSKLKLEPYSTIMLRFGWLGLLDDAPLPFEKGCARDVISHLFGKKLVYAEGEKDLIILMDEYIAEFPSTGIRKRFVSTLVDYGIPGDDSSIARTTGLPPAIAARLILDGEITTPGLHTPVTQEVYEPVLAELEALGIRLEEQEEVL